jgi:phage portal protein BeeE
MRPRPPRPHVAPNPQNILRANMAPTPTPDVVALVRRLYQDGVLPLACRIGSALTHWLTPAFGDGIRLTVDTDNVPALAKDRAAFWDQVGKAAFLTVNEKREAIGFSPIEGGDRL